MGGSGTTIIIGCLSDRDCGKSVCFIIGIEIVRGGAYDEYIR